MVSSLDPGSVFLSSLVHYRTYAATKADGHKETKLEMFSRVENMHLKKYPHIEDEIRKAFEFVYEDLTLPSMRSCQFAGEAIERENTRIYNCSFLALDSFTSFAEIFFILCCGTGVGYSVQNIHINQLPVIEEGYESTFRIPDSKEGWADSVKFLLRNPKLQFDYSLVRPDGAPLSTGGTASGPEPLRLMHEKVRSILRNSRGRKLNAVECSDITCLIADCVVVGSVRRSATICLFDWFDEPMLKYKSGDWFVHSPHRARANISAAIYRNSPDAKIAFERVIEACYDSGSGEPGLAWTNNPDGEYGFNPCIPEFGTVLTPEGIRQFKDIDVGSVIWSGTGWTNVTAKWSTGIKPVYEYRTTMSRFVGTENHRIVQRGEKIQVQDADSIDSSVGIAQTASYIEPQDIMDGLVLGDGTVHKASNNLILLIIGNNDADYFQSEINGKIIGERFGVCQKGYAVHTTLDADEVPLTFERTVPDRFFFGSREKKIGFLRGLFSANGSVVDQRITLKSTSKTLIHQVQEMLSSLGIRSYYTTNHPQKVEFTNGEYLCRESYDLNISAHRYVFAETIGFLQSYKNQKITGETSGSRVNSDIKERTYLGDFEVFDITVDDEAHTFWSGGSLVSNCVEASLRKNEFCNLTSTNAGGCKNEEEFFGAVEAAAIIGTVQAGYDKLGYLRPIWRKNIQESRLLGVSMMGIAEAWDMLTPETLRFAAGIMNKTNARIAGKIGINTAARVGCVKPEGTASAAKGRSSGIHAYIDNYFIRRVRMDKTHPLSVFLLQAMPQCIETDVMNPRNIVVSIPIAKPDAITTKSEDAIGLLERAKVIRKNWITPGHHWGDNPHNVSITVHYKNAEKEEIKKWMWKNRNHYAGIALFPENNTVYPQLPFEGISKEKYDEMIRDFPSDIDLSKVNYGEIADERKNEAACGGGGCEWTGQ